jgi:molybdenum cofactor guanylyltransferase
VSTAAGGFDAVVLAGGTSRRMGGGDKTTLPVGGVPLLDRVLDALAAARRVVVVGDERPTLRPVTWTREQPPGGGPAAAAAAGLRRVDADVVVLLAGDLPFVDGGTVDRVVAAAQPSGAVLGDGDGQPQWLLGAWPRARLTSALAGEQNGASLRAALAPLRPAVLAPAPGGAEWLDCDDPADVSAAQARLGGSADE